MTTARSIVTQAYVIDGIVALGQPLEAAQGQQGLLLINQVLEQWSLMPLTIPVTAREVFPLEAGRGGPSDPYTIGPSGDFDTSRPVSITSVGLLDTGSADTFEIQRSIYTNDAYASIVQKEETSTYFTGLWYSPTFGDGLGTIQLWPVPATDATSLVLYRPMQLRAFTSLDDQYDFPPGAVPALTYELAKWLALSVGVPWSDALDKMCDRLLSVYQRSNTIMVDLGVDPTLTSQAGVYNILSDSSSGQGR